MFKNCSKKILERYSELRKSMAYKIDKLDAEGKVSQTNAVDELETALRSKQQTLLQNKQADMPTISGGADIEAVESSGEKSLYEALRRVLQSVKVETSTTPTEETFVSLSAHSWILGKSKLLESWAEQGLIARKLMLDLDKMGEYFRGTQRLFNHMTDPHLVHLFRNIKLLPVPPPAPRIVDLEFNWYHVIECVYYKYTGRLPGVTRSRILGTYKLAIKNYSNFTKTFIPHAEVALVNHLTNLTTERLQPTPIGISKLCCALCAIYINTINERLYNNRWLVSGCHGSIYLWARGENPSYKVADAEKAVKEYLYAEIVRIVDELSPSLGHSPPEIQPRADAYDQPGASWFPLVSTPSRRLIIRLERINGKECR